MKINKKDLVDWLNSHGDEYEINFSSLRALDRDDIEVRVRFLPVPYKEPAEVFVIRLGNSDRIE